MAYAMAASALLTAVGNTTTAAIPAASNLATSPAGTTAMEYNLEIMSFIVTLDHFAADDNPNDTVENKMIVQLTMQNLPAIMTFLTHHQDALANLSLAETINHVTSHLEVHALNIAAPGGQLQTVFNVYVASLTNDLTLHSQWVNTFTSLNFLSTMHRPAIPSNLLLLVTNASR